MIDRLLAASGTSRRQDLDSATVTHMTQHHQADTGLPPLPSPTASPEERADAVEARLLARVGAAPSLDDYRRAYASCGEPWPGDDEIRQLHPVAQ
ncbi:MAG: hypothetical protein ACRDTE_07670 [Pseudonocardiaceae bacterium]